MRGAGSCLGKESAQDSPQINSNLAKTILNKLWRRIPAPCPLLAALHTDRCLKSRKYGSFHCCSAAAVIRRGSLSLLYCPSSWAGSRSLAGFHAVWGVPANCSIPALTSRDEHMQSEESHLSLHNHCSSDLFHFCPREQILSICLHLSSSVFPAFRPAPLQWWEHRLKEEVPCCLAVGRPTEITLTQISPFGNTIK